MTWPILLAYLLGQVQAFLVVWGVWAVFRKFKTN
jgi:hypothetical protein